MASKPDLLAEFRELAKPRRVKCSIALIGDQLPQDERTLLAAAMADDSLPHTAISGWLSRRGLKISEYTVGRHRAGKCSCG